MIQEEIDIIQKLSAKSAEPNQKFAESLYYHLLDREQELIKISKYKRGRIMNFRNLSIGFASLLVLLGVGVLLLDNKSQNSPTEQIAQTSDKQNTSQDNLSMSLPSEQADNIEDALKSLTFTPLQPSILLSDEIPQPMRVGTKNNMLDDSDTLYMSFADDKGVLYKITQTTKKGNYPEDTVDVAITVEGKSLTAQYYVLSEEVDLSGSAPSSYMFWSNGGIIYEISEFGRVTLEDLVRLANSLIGS